MKWQLFPATDLTLHSEVWDCLNQRGPNTPLLDSRFIMPLIQHFGVGHELLAILGEHDDPDAMLIIGRDRFGVWSTFQPAQAPLGLWLNKVDNSLDELFSSLAKCLPKYTLLMGITHQDPYIYPRPKDSDYLSTIDYIQTAYVNIDQSFEDYWQSRGKNLRHNLKRQRNRLEREGIKPRVEVLTNPDDMHRAVRQYGELEASGWKQDIGTAIHIENIQGKFYVDLLSAFAMTGQAFVYRYFYNDRLVACDLCLFGGAILVILKTTYDETIEGSSPTMLMREEMFRAIFDEQTIQRIEFYGKLMDWHTKWTDSIRQMYHINYIPWKIVKMARGLLSKEKYLVLVGFIKRLT